MQIIKLISIGIVLGVSNVIPGVSGGTMAVVFGVYDKIIEDITLNIKKIISDWKFLLPLVLGLAIGILLFSKIITILFNKYPIPTNWFFIGLIAGSIPLLYNKINTIKSTNSVSFPLFSTVISFCIALGLIIAMILIKQNPTGVQSSQSVFSISIAIKLFITGAIAAIAMIIPGISGSFFMLAIGMYSTVIAAISNLHISFLIIIAIGIIVGLLVGARFVRLVMQKVPIQTYGAIMGLIIGSIFVIFPGFGSNFVILISFGTCIAGFTLAYFSGNKEITT